MSKSNTGHVSRPTPARGGQSVCAAGPAATRTLHPTPASAAGPFVEGVPALSGGLVSVSASVTARRLAAAALAAGALVSVAALPASAADHRPARERVEISAVQADSPGRDDRSNRSLNREWVELTNTTRHAINLDGWTLEDESGKTYTFDDYRLAGRATVRIHTGVGSDTRTDLYQDRRATCGTTTRHRRPAQRRRSPGRRGVLGTPPPPRPLRRRGGLGSPPSRRPLRRRGGLGPHRHHHGGDFRR